MIEDWQWLATGGAIALVLTVMAGWRDHRRMRRTRPDDYGWVPWRGIGFWSLFAAILLLGLAARAWFSG